MRFSFKRFHNSLIINKKSFYYFLPITKFAVSLRSKVNQSVWY